MERNNRVGAVMVLSGVAVLVPWVVASAIGIRLDGFGVLPFLASLVGLAGCPLWIDGSVVKNGTR